MNIFAFSVKRPITVTVIVLALVVISFIFVPRMNIESFPKIDIPVIAVTTAYIGAGPEEIEEQVTIPIEEAVGSVGNIDRIESTSRDNLSIVVVEFKYGTDMAAAAADIRENIDKIRNNLPEEVESPVIIQADPADCPIVQLTLSDKNGNMRRLRSIAYNDIREEIEKIAGIASVTVSGGQERAIVVKVDRDKLESYSLAPNMIVSAIARENADVPTGRITSDKLEYSVRTMGKLSSVDDFKNIMVANVQGTPVFLKDVAQVVDGYKEVRTKVRYNGEPCVSLEIKKNTDANTVKVANAVKEAVERIRPNLPSGFTLDVAYDSSKFVKTAINNLRENAIQGGILAILMVLIFLGSLKSTLVIGLSIPISIAVAFMLMYFNGMTLNMITLVAFILAIGNIVDASIVVLENIFRHLEMEKTPFEAAVDGAREVGGAVTGAAMTSMIVFVPMFLLSGLVGQVFTPLAKTYIFAIGCSLIIALTVVPMLASKLLAGEAENNKKRGLFYFYNRFRENALEKLKSNYLSILKWSINHRPIIIIITLIIFALSLWLSTFLKKELQGKWDRGDFLIQVETPVGSSLSRTTKVVNDVEKYILENVPEYENVITNIGKSPSIRHGARGGGEEAPRMGGFTVVLKNADLRKKEGMRNMYDVQDQIVNEFADYPGAKVRVAEIFNISGRSPIEILIKGNDLEKLARLAENLKEKLKNVEGLKNLDTNYRPGSPEYRIRVDRKKAAEVGLGSSSVYNTLRILMAEDEVSTFRDEGNEYDIFVQLPEDQRDSMEELKNLRLLTPSGRQVALKEIATVEPAFGPSSISRRDRARYVSVQADISGRVLSEVLEDINPILEDLKLPSGYSWTLAGEEQKRQEIFSQMFEVLFLAIILVYVFLAVQFESFIHPFTIMLSVPLELAGIFGALLLFNLTLTMFALLGVIMLVGIVVSAAIVLIDFIILRKNSGLSTTEAVLESAPLRLRPILMTVSTTVVAMVPLALGLKASAQMFQPLAVGAIGGLVTSSILTLLVIPVVYTLMEDLREKIYHKK